MSVFPLFFALLQALLTLDAPHPAMVPDVPVVKMTARSEGDLPESVDNSTSQAFPPIFSQIGGSCAQASTIGYMFTYEVNTLLGRSASTADNRFSYLYSWNFINDGEDDGSLSWDGIKLSLNCGMMSEADFPAQTSVSYFSWASGYDKYFRALHYRVETFRTLTVDSPDAVLKFKRYLYDGGEDGGKGKIAVFSSGSGSWKIDDYYSGPSLTGYKSLLTELPVGGAHAMTIVGYDDTVECKFGGRTTNGAFIVVNSWGKYYHDNGRYYLPYRFFEEVQDSKYLFSKDVTGITVKYVEPVLVYGAGLEYSSRNDLSFSVGAASHPYAQVPEAIWHIDIAANQGGDYPMRGYYGPRDIEFAFDASRIAGEVSKMEDVTYFLGIRRNVSGSIAGTGSLTSFKVCDYSDGEADPKVWTASIGQDAVIAEGQNWYPLRTVPLKTTSASNVKWLDALGSPLKASFIVKTAGGGYAKVRFSDYDRTNGKIKIEYVYSSDSHIGH